VAGGPEDVGVGDIAVVAGGVVAIGEAVGACANELIESAREQIQTMINVFIVVFDHRMRSTPYLDSTILGQPRPTKDFLASNENEISHRWRERAWWRELRFESWKT
jgi:hypothetical protein